MVFKFGVVFQMGDKFRGKTEFLQKISQKKNPLRSALRVPPAAAAQLHSSRPGPGSSRPYEDFSRPRACPAAICRPPPPARERAASSGLRPAPGAPRPSRGAPVPPRLRAGSPSSLLRLPVLQLEAGYFCVHYCCSC